MKAVIYARYSSDSQRDESIDGQIRECEEYAERNGLKVLSCYIDRALSAKTDNRPEFQRMIRDSAGGLFDVVLVWKLDRFARNRYDSAHYKAILKKNGVKVVSARETIAEDSTGILLESMLEGYAEFFSAELSEKVQRGLMENALKGKNNGGGIPLGYVLNHQTQKLEIDPLTAPLVVEIFTRYADGETVRSIVDDLNEQGLRNPRGKPFRLNSFSGLLTNRKYIGEYQYKDVVIPGGVPAIVPQELFDRVQRRKERNRRAPAAAKAEVRYLLTNILLIYNYKDGQETVPLKEANDSVLSGSCVPKEEAKKDIGQKSPVFSRLPRPVDQRIYGPHFFDISILDLRSGGTQTRILNEESATCFWPGSWMQDPGFSIL